MPRAKRWPDFFIVGAPKCGTTVMNDYLAEHPQIFMGPKELHYFGAEWDRLTEAAYLSLFSRASPEQRIGEASVHYLSSPSAPAAIATVAPHAQIIAMLRDPVEAVSALHDEMVFQGREDRQDLEQALAAEARRQELIPEDLTDPLLYREQYDYATQLERYVHHFGREQILIVVYEQFRAYNLREYHRVLRFLEVELHHPRIRTVNPRKQARLQAVHRFVLDHPEWLRQLSRALLPEDLRRRAWRTAMHATSRRVTPKPIDQDLTRELAKEFEPGIRRLEVAFGLDLNVWRAHR